MADRAYRGMQGSMLIPSPAEAAAGQARYYLARLLESCELGKPDLYWYAAATESLRGYARVRNEMASEFAQRRIEAQLLWEQHPNHPNRRTA